MDDPTDDEPQTWDILHACYPTQEGPWLVSGSDVAPMTLRLKEAEAAATFAAEWASIAVAWLDVIGPDGLRSAIRCAENALPCEPVASSWVLGAQAWIRIAEFEPDHLAKALVWLRRAETYIADASEAAMCARTWMMIPEPSARDHALRLMGMAEDWYDGQDYNLKTICMSWLHSFGAEGVERMQAFLKRIGCGPP